MSSHSSHRCSEQHRTSNRTQKWASLNLRFCSNHGGRRKDNANICSNSMASSDSAQRLALVAAAVCAGVIQMYTPVPQQVPPSFSMDHLGTTLLLGHSSRLDIVRGWVEGRLGELLRKSSRSQALERTVARIGSSLSNPPPPLFFGACLCLAWAISFVRQSHLADRFQDRILIGGVAVGVLVAAVQSERLLMDVKGYLAWSVVLASVGSLLSHRILGRFGPRTKGTAGEIRDLGIKADGY